MLKAIEFSSCFFQKLLSTLHLNLHPSTLHIEHVSAHTKRIDRVWLWNIFSHPHLKTEVICHSPFWLYVSQHRQDAGTTTNPQMKGKEQIWSRYLMDCGISEAAPGQRHASGGHRPRRARESLLARETFLAREWESERELQPFLACISRV